MIYLALYLTGYLVALGYQMSEAENEYRPVELVACPILWPICLPIQVLLFIPKWRKRVKLSGPNVLIERAKLAAKYRLASDEILRKLETE